jgi:hypothetical protein
LVVGYWLLVAGDQWSVFSLVSAYLFARDDWLPTMITDHRPLTTEA